MPGTEPTTGEVLFGSSLTLTNEYLYYLVGNSFGGSWYYSSWKDHFVYRYDLDGGAGVDESETIPS